MYCRQCGNELFDEDIFCGRCGKAVNEEPKRTMGAEGLTLAAKESERIIEEFYKKNKRREETQVILDMEFAAIKGEPVKVKDLDSVILGRQEPEEAESEVVSEETKAELEPETEVVSEEIKTEPEAESEVVSEETKAELEPETEVVSEETKAEPEAESEEVSEETKAELEPETEVVSDEIKTEPEAESEETSKEPEVESEEVSEETKAELEPETEVISEETKAEEITEKPEAKKESLKYEPTEKDLEEWDEIFPHYMPELYFDPPEVVLYDYDELDATDAVDGEAEAEDNAEAGTEDVVVVAAEVHEEASAEPAQQNQPIDNNLPPSRHEADNMFATAESDAQDIASSISGLENQKLAIDQQAQATLNMMEQMFAEFDKPLAASIGNSFAAEGGLQGTGSTITASAGMNSASAGLNATAAGGAASEGLYSELGSSLNDTTDISDLGTGVAAIAAGMGVASSITSSTKANLADAYKAQTTVRKKTTADVTPGKSSNWIAMSDRAADLEAAIEAKHGTSEASEIRAENRAYLQSELEEEQYARSGGAIAKKVLMGIFTALLLIAAIISVLVTFGRETTAGQTVLNIWDNIKNDSSEQVEELDVAEEQQSSNQNPSTASMAVAIGEGEPEGGVNAGEETASEETASEETASEETASSEPEGGATENTSTATTDRTLSEIDASIASLASDAGIAEAVKNSDLTMTPGREYGAEGFYASSIFVDGTFYNRNGQDVSYNEAIFATAAEYYAKLLNRMNRDDAEVLDMIVSGSKLMTDVSGIKADPVVLHYLPKLEVGEARKNGNDYYVLIRTRETANDGRSPITSQRILHLVTEGEGFKIAEVVNAD